MKKIDKQGQPELPIIEITGMRDEVYTVLTMNLDDNTFRLFVEEGRRIADDQKYFEIGFLHALEETLKKEIPIKKVKKHGTTRTRKSNNR